jgi:hypothetical protein
LSADAGTWFWLRGTRGLLSNLLVDHAFLYLRLVHGSPPMTPSFMRGTLGIPPTVASLRAQVLRNPRRSLRRASRSRRGTAGKRRMGPSRSGPRGLRSRPLRRPPAAARAALAADPGTWTRERVKGACGIVGTEGLLRNPLARKCGLSRRSVGGTTDRLDRP